jgi:multifunctional methyltransferase subunit TRM112
MKLLTHNHLKSPVKNVITGYPMQLVIEEMEIVTSEEIEDGQLQFVKDILPTLEWAAVVQAAQQIEGFKEILPETFDSSLLNDETFVEAMYHFLIDIEILKGKLICPESGKEFPIEDGIPNMM